MVTSKSCIRIERFGLLVRLELADKTMASDGKVDAAGAAIVGAKRDGVMHNCAPVVVWQMKVEIQRAPQSGYSRSPLSPAKKQIQS